MIYKLGTLKDMEHCRDAIPCPVLDVLHPQLALLSEEYGEDRDVDRDDGGYLLYCEQGCSETELREAFDYRDADPEFVEIHDEVSPPLLSLLYLCNNEYAVTLFIHEDDLPDELVEVI